MEVSAELEQLIALLPDYEEIKPIVVGHDEAAHVMSMALEYLKHLYRNPGNAVHAAVDQEELGYLMHAIVDYYWERIHTGVYSEVTQATRQIYALANLFHIFFLLLESTDARQMEVCRKSLDDALLLGCTKNLYVNGDHLKYELFKYLDKYSEPLTYELPVITPRPRDLNALCDIPQLSKPSLEEFRKAHFQEHLPALIWDTMQDWPALSKWHDLNYILKVAGNRTVPIEIGANYTQNEWGQQLMKLGDFLHRQFPLEHSATAVKPQPIEYLAQHELFDQIPELKEDIRIPVYCTLKEEAKEQEDAARKPPQESGHNEVDIKAWLGPKGTVSPLHQDPKHNLLCQVFGHKTVILASPADTHNLYPFDSAMMENTSQVDAASLDFERFPLVQRVKFYHLTLQAGACLYLPPKWWHYVRSESESFSVSFWWK